MGPGHLAVALAAKPFAPKAPLWALLVASEAADLLSFGFMAAGIEKPGVTQVSIAQGVSFVTQGSIPWSHGLFMSAVWSVLAAAAAYLVSRDRRVGGVIGLVVFSHWLLDSVVHLPDLPLFFEGSPKVGLGLWGTGPGFVLSCILEVLLFAGAISVYVTWRRKKRIAPGALK
jgi:membrane-bound metal-dependent hydrolase YbcI (DUF457 family)